jgi:DNA (cytosine-5)-methyltransferase 1
VACEAGDVPKGRRYDGTNRRVVEIGSFPVWKQRPPLHRFLRYKGTLLSARATAGFLSRAEASSLRFVPGFLESVRAHLKCMRHDEATRSKISSFKPPELKAGVLIAEQIKVA